MKVFTKLCLLIILALSIVACEDIDPTTDGQVTNSDFDLLCKSGTPIVDSPAYDPAGSGIHYVVAMTDSTSGKKYDEFFQQHLVDAPASWELPRTPENVFDYGAVELVACVTQTETAPLDECGFDDGYALNIHSASYDLKIYAAQTGELLDSDQVNLQSDCPSMHMFSEKEEDYYPVIDQGLFQLFLAPHVEK